MAINKNFVVKNGIEVNTNQIFADATTGKVGIGSTQPGVVLDVQGGIAATDVVTYDLRVAGFSTFSEAVVAQDNLNVSGFSTARDINILGVTSTANFKALGISTFTGAIDADSFVDVAGNVKVAGITTLTGTVTASSSLNVSGITTLASSGGITTTGGDFYVGGELYVADDITYDEISGRNMTITQQTTTKDLTVTGVGTFSGQTNLTNTNVTAGILSATGQTNLANVNVSAAGTVAALTATTGTVSGQTTLANVNVATGIATVAGQTNLANVNVSAAATIANLTVTGSITGSSAIGIQSGGNWVSTATTTLNLSQSGLTAVTDATSGITTVTIASGVSLGLAIALGG